MHHHSHPNLFFIFSLFLFNISKLFCKKDFENFSLLRKLQIFTLRIVSRAIEYVVLDLVNVKSKLEIFSNFVAFLENLNFKNVNTDLNTYYW